MANVSFQAPSEYQVEAEDIARRRKYAEMLQQQAMQPIQDAPTPAGGFAVPTSWTHGLAKALQGYSARKGLERATAEQKALGERYSAERGSALAAAMAAGRGAPASSEQIMDEQAAGGEGQMAQINAPAVAPNRSAMLAQLVSSKFPDLQSAGMAQQMKDMEPVKLTPGSVYGVPGQPPTMTAPFKPDAPLKPEAPHTRSIQRGDQKVYQEFDPASRTWSDVPGASGPAFARQVPPVVLAGGAGKPQKPPVGYRFSSDGETLEPIPGGPKDKASAPLPTQALRLQQAEVDAISGASAINADLAAVRSQIETGKLKLNLASNLAGQARNFIGVSDENSRNLATFKATLERLRNESLRLNKGVQTEGDAVRAWNELFANINDSAVVKQRLNEIEATNARAIDFRKMNIDNIRNNYSAGPLDLSGQQNQAPAIGATPARRAGDVPGAVPDMPPPGAVRRR